MKFPTYKAGPVEYWIGEAITEFANGCIDGLGVGGIVGGGTGATTAFSDLGQSMSPAKQVLLAIAGFGATLLGNGIKRFTIWHANNHPFPNPWPKSIDTTTPPFPSPPTQ